MKILSLCTPLRPADILTLNYGMFFNSKNINFKVINLTFSQMSEKLFKKFNIQYQTISNIDIGFTPSRREYFYLFLILLRYVPKLRKIIKNEHPDYIFVNGFPLSFLTPISLFGEKFKMIYFHHGVKQEESRMLRKVYLYFLRKYNLIIGVSSLVEKSLKKIFPELEEKIISFPNCIDLKKFDIKDKKEDIRKKLNLPEGVLGICVGRLTKFKNQEFLIKVAKEIETKNFKIIIVGKGDEYENLKRKIEKHNLKERVFLVGHKEWEMIPYYLKASDMFLYPSLVEAIGVVMIEAMASGLPIVIFKNIYMPEFGKNIFVAGNDQEFIEMTKNLIANEKLRNETGEKNRMWALENFDIYKNGEKLLDIFQKME